MRLAPLILITALLLRPSPGRGAESGPQTINGIAFKVNDAVITFREIDDEISDTSMRLLRSQYGRQPEVFQQKLDKLKNDTVQLLIERQLILDEFKSAGYKLTESYIDEVVKRRIRNQFGDRVTMIKSLEHDGISYETFRQRVREDFIVNAMILKNASAEKIIVSPHKIAAYYAQNTNQFKVEDEISLRMIFLANKPDQDAAATKKKAEEILAKLKGGTAFAEMATLNSDDSHRTEGGLRSAETRKTLREDLAKEAFALKAGELSDVLERPEGCYLMKVEEVRPAHVKPLNEARAEIEKSLATDEEQRMRKAWIDRLKTKSFVKSFTG
jgi:peptidyl-prolyl cis-trans isomerase SurA